MCLRPRFIVNRKYIKLAGSPVDAISMFAHAPDLYVLVDCGNCLPCQKKRSNMWRQRLIDEFTYLVAKDPDVAHRVYFVTLTIAPNFYINNVKHVYTLFKKFRERYRKRYGKSLRYWVTTEYGEKRGRLHLHAIFFDPLFNGYELYDLWSYGRVDMSVVGDSPKNTDRDPLKGIAYVTKYVTKYCDSWFVDPEKKATIFCSPGIGLSYVRDAKNRDFHSQHGGLRFRLSDNNMPIGLPRYYTEKLFSPIDKFRFSKLNIERLNNPPEFPIKIGKQIFYNFESYLTFINSIGGYLPLTPAAFKKLKPIEQILYLSQIYPKL